MAILKYLGIGWIAAVIIGYGAHRFLSEHGGGIIFSSGTGDLYLIAFAMLPGIGLIKLSGKSQS